MACSGLQGLCPLDCEGPKARDWKHEVFSPVREEDKGRMQEEGEVQPELRVWPRKAPLRVSAPSLWFWMTKGSSGEERG